MKPPSIEQQLKDINAWLNGWTRNVWMETISVPKLRKLCVVEAEDLPETLKRLRIRQPPVPPDCLPKHVMWELVSAALGDWLVYRVARRRYFGKREL